MENNTCIDSGWTPPSWEQIGTLTVTLLTLANTLHLSWKLKHFESKCCIKNGRECCSFQVDSEQESVQA